jgi:hypothetical protein
MLGWCGFPHVINLRRAQGVGLVDEVAEGALRDQRFGGEGAGGFEGARVFVAQRVKAGGGLVSIVRTCWGEDAICCFLAASPFHFPFNSPVRRIIAHADRKFDSARAGVDGPG